MRNRNRYRRCVAGAVAIGLNSGLASGSTDLWSNPSGGVWNLSANWSPSVPTNNDDAVFNTGSATPYTITLPAYQTSNSFTVQNDSVTLNLGSGGFYVASPYTGNPNMGLLNVTSAAGNSSSLTIVGQGTAVTNGRMGVAAAVHVGGGGASSLTIDDAQVYNTDVPASGFTFDTGSTLLIRNGGQLINGNIGNCTAAGTETLNSGGLTVTSRLLIGSTGTGATFSMYNGSGASAGDTIVGPLGTTGTFIVNGSSSVDSNNGSPNVLSVGGGTFAGTGGGSANGGTGSMLIDNGGYANANQTYVGANGGLGTLTLNGASSTLTSGFVSIGTSGGTGTVALNNSASVSAFSTTVGPGGRLSVHTGSTFKTISLSIDPAATVDFTGGTILLNNGTITATALTVPAGANLLGDGTIPATTNAGRIGVVLGATNYVPPVQYASLQLTAAAFNQSAGGLLDIPMGGPAFNTGYGRFSVTGTANWGGTLEVDLTGGFDPAAGQSFQILSFGAGTGTFSTLNLPTLDSGLAWDTSALYSTGTISVVPEPASAGLILAGLVATRRRRSRKGS